MTNLESKVGNSVNTVNTLTASPRKSGGSSLNKFLVGSAVMAAIYGIDMIIPGNGILNLKPKTNLTDGLNPGEVDRDAEAAEQECERFDWLPEYPIRRKIGVIMNGDSKETRHIENVDRAIRVLKAKGFDAIYVAQAAKVEDVKQFSGDKAGLDRMFNAIQPELKEDTLVFVYGTGHGSDEENGSLVMADESIGFAEMQGYLSRIADKNSKAIVVFDNCSSGDFAGLIKGSGLEGLLVSPGKGSDTTSCNDYAPIFFDELGKGIDFNGDKSTEIYEAHLAAMRNYRNQRGPGESGTYVQSKIELTEANYEQVLASGKPVLIDITAPWCGWCQKLKPEIDKVISEVGGGLTVCTITLSDEKVNPNPEAVLDKLGIQAAGLPSLFIRKGKGYELLSGRAGFREADDLLKELQQEAGVKTMDEHMKNKGEYHPRVASRSNPKPEKEAAKGSVVAVTPPEPVNPKPGNTQNQPPVNPVAEKTGGAATAKTEKPQSDYEKKMAELGKSTQSIIERMQRRAQGLKTESQAPVAPQPPAAQPAGQPTQQPSLDEIIKRMQERARRLSAEKS